MLQVFDVMIHRLLEVDKMQKTLDAILEQVGCLYKFHGNQNFFFLSIFLYILFCYFFYFHDLLQIICYLLKEI